MKRFLKRFVVTATSKVEMFIEKGIRLLKHVVM